MTSNATEPLVKLDVTFLGFAHTAGIMKWLH